MTRAELLIAVRQDLGDTDAVLFSDAALERCVTRAIYPVRQDTGTALLPINGEFVPQYRDRLCITTNLAMIIHSHYTTQLENKPA